MAHGRLAPLEILALRASGARPLLPRPVHTPLLLTHPPVWSQLMRLRKYFSVLYQGELVELPPIGLGLSTVRGLTTTRWTVEKVAVATVAAGSAPSG